MSCCADVHKLLYDYVAGALAAPHRQVLEEHLRGCPSCDAYIDSYRQTVLLARRLPETPPPPELLERLLAALEADGAAGELA